MLFSIFTYFKNLFSESSYNNTKIVFQRSLAFLYAIAYLILINQASGLFGPKGILPAQLLLKRVEFLNAPSIFHFGFNDLLIYTYSIVGFIISILAIFGITERFGHIISSIFWFYLWSIYLSFINIGQTFYSYGWETMLTEVGFLAIFLGPRNSIGKKSSQS